jgi:hypothetical protein
MVFEAFNFNKHSFLVHVSHRNCRGIEISMGIYSQVGRAFVKSSGYLYCPEYLASLCLVG